MKLEKTSFINALCLYKQSYKRLKLSIKSAKSEVCGINSAFSINKYVLKNFYHFFRILTSIFGFYGSKSTYKKNLFLSGDILLHTELYPTPRLHRIQTIFFSMMYKIFIYTVNTNNIILPHENNHKVPHLHFKTVYPNNSSYPRTSPSRECRLTIHLSLPQLSRTRSK